MREIKFRAFDPNKNLMAYPDGSLIMTLEEGYSHLEQCFNLADRVYLATNYPDYDNDGEKPCVLMQYTGLKDKNGKEIYEGDILKNHTGIGVVIWISEEDGFDITGWVTSKYNSNCTPSEIIGNRFQNSELLKEPNE